MEGVAMPRVPFVRKHGRRAEKDRVHQMVDDGDLEGLVELLNEQAGTRVAEVDQGGIRSIPGATNTDLDELRRLAQEDPGRALDLVRGPPLLGIEGSWAGPLRAQIQTEIVVAAHAACRLDPTNAAEYLRKGLVGAPGDTSLWIALLSVAGQAGSMPALEMVYGWALDTFASAGPGTVPTEITREFALWQRNLRSG